MADPNYLLANSVSVTVGSDTLYLEVTELSEDGEEIDCTNNVLKVYECEVGIVRKSFSFTAMIPVSAVPTFRTANTTLAATWGGGGGPGVTGNVKILNARVNGGSRGRRNITGTAVFTGTTTNT
jgi:hypothetical protein